MEQNGTLIVPLVGQAVPSAGGLGELVNPEGVPLIVDSIHLLVDTPSAGAANINVGFGTAGADNSDQLSAVAINGALTGKVYNGLAPAAEAEVTVWGKDKVVNATGSAACTAFRGRLMIKYTRIPTR